MEFQETLATIAESFAPVTGEDFFRSLVLRLARMLDVDLAYVGKALGEPPASVQTLAVATREGAAENFRYGLDGAPCREVLRNGPCLHAEAVQERFPLDSDLEQLHAEAYAGVPLLASSGQALGILVVIDSKPFGKRTESILPLLAILGGRAAAELERLEMEHRLEEKARLLDAVRQVQQLYLSSDEPKPVFERLAALLAETTDSPYAVIAEIPAEKEDSHTLRLLAFAGVPDGLAPRILDEAPDGGYLFPCVGNLFGRMIETGEPVVSGPVAKGESTDRLPPNHPELSSFLGLPLTAGGELVGVAGVGNRPGGYDDQLARFLEPLAGACGAIIRAVHREQAVKAAVETLHSKEQFLESVIESLDHPFYVIDAQDFTIKLANRASRHHQVITGAATCYELTHGRSEPCSDADHPCPLQVVTRTGRAAVIRHLHDYPDGESRNCEIHAYPIRNDRGEIVQMIEYTLDITERVCAEEALQRKNRELEIRNWVLASAASGTASEQLVETVCEKLARTLGVPFGAAVMVDHDSLEAVVTADPLAEGRPSLVGTKVGLEGGEAYRELFEHGRPLVVADALNDPRLAHHRRVLERFGVASVLFVPLAVDGRVRGVLGLGRREPRRFADHEVELALNVAAQTANAMAMAELSASRRRLQAAVEHMAEMIVITDEGGGITYVNPAFERITGYRGDEVRGLNPRALKSGRQGADFYRDLWQTITEGRVWRGRFVNRSKDGTLFTEDATISPVRSDDGKIVSFVKVARDVTGQLDLEAQLQQAQRMESIARFAGGIAHDFNNVLGAVMGYAELGLAQVDAGRPVDEPLREILDAAASGADLTRRLLTFARGGTVDEIAKMRPQDVTEIVRSMEGMLRRLIGDDVELATRLDPSPAPVVGSRSQLEQVIMNLAVNARDAMPDGGRLSIEVTRCRGSEHPVAEPPAPGTDRWVCLSVQDTGVGIPSGVLEHIFEPFFTTKTPGKGTGLGLATCYGIVQQMGGRIAVASEPGVGTTFTVYFPAADAEVP